MGTAEEEETKDGVRLTPMTESSSEISISEEAALVSHPRRVSLHTAVRLRKAVIIVSIISIIVLLLLGSFTLVGASLELSSSAFAFALNAFLDTLSSVVVLWRFSGNGGNLYAVGKECIACIILGCFFLLSSVLIAGKSSYALATSMLPISSPFLYYGSMVNAIACVLLIIAKLYLAYKLESRSLLTDAFNTLAGVILAVSTIISEEVYRANTSIWQIDGITGLVCSLFLLGYGTWIIYESRLTLKAEKDVKLGLTGK